MHCSCKSNLASSLLGHEQYVIDLRRGILFSISEGGPGYKAAPVELAAFQCLAQGHLSRVDDFQHVGFKEVSVIIYTPIFICVAYTV